MSRLSHDIGELLRSHGLTLGVVESATGGLISHLITGVAGSSDYYRGAVIAYSNETKVNVTGVKEATIGRYGAVSPQVAEEMARGGRELLAVDICLSDTGVAGPGGGSEEKPVGLFYFGLAHGAVVRSHEYLSRGTREMNKLYAAEAALGWLKEYLLSLA